MSHFGHFSTFYCLIKVQKFEIWHKVSKHKEFTLIMVQLKKHFASNNQSKKKLASKKILAYLGGMIGVCYFLIICNLNVPSANPFEPATPTITLYGRCIVKISLTILV